MSKHGRGQQRVTPLGRVGEKLLSKVNENKSRTLSISNVELYQAMTAGADPTGFRLPKDSVVSTLC